MSERRNRILLDMVRSMTSFASLSISFSRYALKIACYILNKMLSKSVDKILYEIWTGCKPVLSHLRVWGCPAYVKRLKTDKLRPKFDRCLFVGYPKETKGYYFYLTVEQKVFVSSRAVFLKKEFLKEGANACKIKLNEVQKVKGPTHTELDLIEKSNLKSVEVPLRRSSRVPHQSDRY